MCGMGEIPDNVIPLRRSPRTQPVDADLLRLATWLGAAFRERGMSLSDPGTADAYSVTCEAFAVLLKGAERLGEITPEARAYLDTVVQDLLAVPEALGKA
jgi:hypothetical protein